MRAPIASIALAATLLSVALPPHAAQAGSILLTGHDPDAHAIVGYHNREGARRFLRAVASWMMTIGINPFVGVTRPKFLLVEGKIPVPSHHNQGRDGWVLSGFVENVDFEHHDFTTLNAELDRLGEKYAAIVVGSDYAGLLTQAELDVLMARSADIMAFLNAGGGLFAMAETSDEAGLTSGPHYGFFPGIRTERRLALHEQIHTTEFGASIGLNENDLNGNISHCHFIEYGALVPADIAEDGSVLSVGTRDVVTATRGSTWGELKSRYRDSRRAMHRHPAATSP